MDFETFDPRPAEYPDTLPGFRARRGQLAAVRSLARAERIPVAEFLRRAVSEHVARVRQDRDDDPGPFSPAPGMRAAA